MSEPVRVLYIHPFAVAGGATKSLLEMFRALPPGAVAGTVLAPRGATAGALASAGMDVIRARGIAQWDDTRFGHYRGWRWLILLREIAFWPATLWGLARAVPKGPYDLIHCNEITALLVGVLAKRKLRVPLLVHVRSLQRGDAGGRISARLRGLLATWADAVVVIDEAVRRTLPADQPVTVIHNGMAAGDDVLLRQGDATFCVGSVGVLHRSKGIYELVEAIRILRDRGLQVRLLIAGENVRRLSGMSGWLLRKLDFARDVREDLEAYVDRHALRDRVEFAGFVSDVRQVYQRTDAICFPSHLDAPGRPVFEAALFGRPTIVAMRNPTSDVVVDGETGVCIDRPSPTVIADAIASLASDRDRARAMGERARVRALARFDSRICAANMLALYRRITGRSDQR